MAQTVLITGTGRPHALGFNLVKRYLENGDRVLASIRRPSEALEELRKDYEHAETLVGCLRSAGTTRKGLCSSPMRESLIPGNQTREMNPAKEKRA